MLPSYLQLARLGRLSSHGAFSLPRLSGKFQGECAAVKDKVGKRIKIEDKQLRAEHFREVLNRPDPA